MLQISINDPDTHFSAAKHLETSAKAVSEIEIQGIDTAQKSLERAPDSSLCNVPSQAPPELSNNITNITAT